MYDLPPVAFKKQGQFDNDLLRDQHDLILKGLNSMANEFDDLDIRDKDGNDANDGKSFKDVIREKREQTEKILEDTKTNKQESLEERKKRLQAHRDILLKMKKEQRN
jgi:hypothetical protein